MQYSITSAFVGENAAAGITRLNGVCLAGAQGTSLYYRAVVPARATLVFNATPVGAWDPALRLLNGCAATACLASVNAGGNSAAETLRWTNTGTAPATVYVTASSVDAAVSGTFNGTVQILPPPTNGLCSAATAVTSHRCACVKSTRTRVAVSRRSNRSANISALAKNTCPDTV